MGTKVSGGNSTFLAPSGSHIARAIRVLDVGTHTSERFGSRNHQVVISWELPLALIEDGDYAGEPFVVNRTYTLSLHKKSNLRPDLEAWRGKQFTGQEIQDGFEIAEMVGQPCMLTVTHSNPNDEGRVYANVTGVAALMKGTDCPKQVNESLVYDIDAPDGEVYSQLAPWQQKLIDSSEETVNLDVAKEKAREPVQDDAPF